MSIEVTSQEVVEYPVSSYKVMEGLTERDFLVSLPSFPFRRWK